MFFYSALQDLRFFDILCPAICAKKSFLEFSAIEVFDEKKNREYILLSHREPAKDAPCRIRDAASLLLAVLVLYCLLDFDTQFVSFALLLFLVLDAEPQARKPVSSGRAIRGLTAAIRLCRYNLAEYLDYFDILRYARERYLQRGDTDSADTCLSLITEIPKMLEIVDAQTSRLGRIIRDKPDLTLPPPYVSWLEQHASEFVSNS